MTAQQEDIDYLFTRLTADKLARAIFTKDVRVVPTTAQVAEAQEILNRTGYLYRMVAGFQIDWQRTIAMTAQRPAQSDNPS